MRLHGRPIYCLGPSYALRWLALLLQSPDVGSVPAIELHACLGGVGRQDLGVALGALHGNAPRRSRPLLLGLHHAPNLGPEMTFRDAVKRCGRDLVAALQRLIALRLKRPMIDPRLQSRRRQRPVLMVGPGLAPFIKQGLAIPLTGFDRMQARACGSAQRKEDMRVMVMRVVAFLQHGRMDRDIGDHAATDESLLDEV